MHLVIDLNARAAERLVQAARMRGVDPAALLESLVTEHLPPVAASNHLADFPSTGRSIERLQARLVAEATDDPEAIRKAQDNLEEMKRSMNAERALSGAEPIF